MTNIWIFIVFLLGQDVAHGVSLFIGPWAVGPAIANGVSFSIGTWLAVFLFGVSAGLFMIFFLAAVLLCMLKKCALIKK